MSKSKHVNIKFNNKIKNIKIDLDIFDDFKQFKFFLLENLEIHKEDIFLINQNSKLITKFNFKELDLEEIHIIKRINGGVVDGIYNMLKGIINMFEGLFKILVEFTRLVELLFDIIPIIFSPTELIDDIMFGVTFGINEMMKGISATISNGVSDPEDESAEQGPFALQSDDGGKTCMNPTYSTLFLLILCPPLAIIYKLGFLRGFVSAIICGVLCVKLFYFPGLLFAILHVLC